MKGLLYKEFYLSGKTYLSFIALTLMLGILGILICLSMICGNLKPMALEDPEMLPDFASMFTYLPFILSLISVIGVNHSIYDDYNTKWMLYSYTLPVKPVKAIGVRYLAGAIVLGICFLYGSVHGLILSYITGISLTLELFQNMAIILVLATFIFSLLLPMGLKYKLANKVSNRCIIVVCLLYLSVAVLFFVKYSGTSGDATLEKDIQRFIEAYRTARDILVPLAPLMIVAILGCSLLISIKFYQRREK